MSSINDDLIRAYKNTRNLISKDPANKDIIISEYIDLVNKLNNCNKPQQPDYNHKTEFSKMLKNPLEISIYNNFQRYNDEPHIINPILTKAPIKTKTSNDSINELADVSAYFK
jgi:hypothetical protein